MASRRGETNDPGTRASRDGKSLAPQGIRVAVVGPAGAGKTTVCEVLRDRTGMPVIEMDALFWEPGWQAVPEEELLRRVGECTRGDGWILDGQYPVVHPMILERADVVLWLDPGFWTCTKNVLKRTVSRIVRKHPLWNGNHETLLNVLGRDSIIWYSMSVYRAVIRQNQKLFENLSERQLALRLRSQIEQRDAIERICKLVDRQKSKRESK